ncbi:MAG: IS30 family transposase [Desulfobulbaceae bacterium]|jgi:IS30 family transposase|nr:IS30 family transposase [Desulfobulbaceae bacterium]
MSYKHLSLAERYYIEIELKMKVSINQIAKAMKRSHSTISREITRNTGQRGYRHKQANCLAEKRHAAKHKAVKLSDEIKYLINVCLRNDWSPEQIAGRLQDEQLIAILHETVYQYILADKAGGGLLYKHLRHQGKIYRKRYGSAHNRSGIPNRIDIDQRPTEANNRERIGDWEADTIIGKNHKGAIVTLDDRKSKLRLAAPLPGKKAKYVKDAMISLFSPIKKFVKTVTFDNGKEFTLHENIASELDCKTYFAKPYHSWERGQNENANGLLRQYFPKGMELVDISMIQVVVAIDKLNSRPRKCLKFKTPYEVFEKLTGVNVRKLMGYALIT